MRARVVAWVERVAEGAARRRAETVAARLRELVGSASVSVEGTDVVVSGRGMAARWLNDPELRFSSGGGR